MKTTKKRIIALIAVLLAVSGVFAGFRIYQSYLRQITGQEWFEKQDKIGRASCRERVSSPV